MLSNAYFLAKFRFDTAENEPAKKLQNFANFPNFAKVAAAADRYPLYLETEAENACLWSYRGRADYVLVLHAP